MTDGAVVPTYFGRLRSLAVLIGIASNPLSTMQCLHAANGRYVILSYPQSRPSRPKILACIADPGLYRVVTLNSAAWRSVNVGMRGFRNHASHRLSRGFTRLRGPRHAHYRRLLSLPLSKPAVAGMKREMAAIAMRNVESWPRNQVMDFMPLANRLMQDFAISLLLGSDRARALPVANMISIGAAAAWPFPGRAYLKWLRTAPKLERALNEWADEKRGELDPKDIFSVLVNNPDNGWPPAAEMTGGLLTFTFGAAYETCQTALAWTLILLAQHPKVVTALTEEIDGVGGGLPTMDRIDTLPLLDAVTKEGMRLFPPVPIQFRRSTAETVLGAARIPFGMRVLTSAFLINRDPALYDEPDKFKPERWRGMDRSPHEYPVFGAGSHLCPGALFGNQMVKIALSAILLSHRVELAPRAHIDHRTTITLAPRPGVPIILRDKGVKPSATSLAGSIHELVDLSGAR